MKILEVGPSPKRSKGGMATVIDGILHDEQFNDEFNIDCHESYIDGRLFRRIIYSIYAYFKFRLIYKKYDLFHIHVASYGSTFRKGYYVRFLKKHGKKVVLHVHGAEYMLFYNKLNDRKKEIVNDIWKKSDVVVALSNEWKHKFEKTFHIPDIHVINNGVKVSEFSDAISDSVEYRDKFLFLGRLGERKGTYDILNAVERLKEDFPKLKVYIAGDGEIDKVKSIIEKKNLNENIEVLGWIDFKSKINIMKKVTTILLPSYNEGLPMTILEGMAAGKVIISTNIGAIPEVVINNQNGIIISPGDILSLKNAMEKVMIDDEFNIACSKNNVKRIDEYYSQKYWHSKLKNIFLLQRN